MMIAIGNFFFKYRNKLFPLAFLLMLVEEPWPVCQTLPAQNAILLAGLLVALGGQSLRAITVGLAYIKRGGKDKQVYADTLVTEGIFAHCRNPLYVGNILIVIGVGIASNSLLFVVLGIPFFLFVYVAIVKAEENYLRGKFGAAFDEYCRRVRRFVPRLTGLGATLRGMEFHWRRLIVKEYQTPFLWMTGLTVLVMKRYYSHFGYDGSKEVLWALVAWFVVLFSAFLFAWYLKKAKIIRAD